MRITGRRTSVLQPPPGRDIQLHLAAREVGRIAGTDADRFADLVFRTVPVAAGASGIRRRGMNHARHHDNAGKEHELETGWQPSFAWPQSSANRHFVDAPPSVSRIWAKARQSGFLQKLRAQHETLDLGMTAFDLVRFVRQVDALDHGAALQGLGGSLDLQILDQRDVVAFLEDRAIAVLDVHFRRPLLRSVSREGKPDSNHCSAVAPSRRFVQHRRASAPNSRTPGREKCPAFAQIENVSGRRGECAMFGDDLFSASNGRLLGIVTHGKAFGTDELDIGRYR